jgi:oligopeptide transport system ATP-binding protein
MADEVAVMYGGRVFERGPVDELFYRPSHPYTLGLQAAMPHDREGVRARLAPIEGSPPDLFHPPPGCPYADRCPFVMQVCRAEEPPLWPVDPAHGSRCWLHHAQARARRPAELHTGAEMGAAVA